MPDEYGKLSDQEFATAKEWLTKRIKGPCSACGNRSWTLAKHVMSMRTEVKNFLGETPYFPALLMICNNCGYFRFHGARRAGIKRYDNNPEKEAEDVG